MHFPGDTAALAHLRPKRRTGALSPLVLVLLPCLAVAAIVVDVLLFSIFAKMYEQPHDFRAYLEERIGYADSASPFADRDLGARPLTLREKARLADHIGLALPDPRPGWTRRDFETPDHWALLPWTKGCARWSQDVLNAYARMGNGPRSCPSGAGGAGMTVYAKGDKRIAVMLRYSRDADDRHKKITPRHAIPPIVHQSFVTNKDALPVYHRRKGFAFLSYPRQSETILEGPRSWPIRLYAKRAEGDGTVEVIVVSNASRAETVPILNGLDFDLIAAFQAPPAPA